MKKTKKNLTNSNDHKKFSHSHFSHIALIGRVGKNISDTLIAVKEYILSKKILLSIEENTAEMMQETDLPTFNDHQVPKECDLMIVVGGDGSLLNAAHCALPTDIPVLGINRGRLGFLTDIHPHELSKIGEVLSGEYLAEERFLLSAINLDETSQSHLGIALNEVVLLPGDSAQLIEFAIHINDQFVCQLRADGLIVTTPTGSTAYALSGGGPILHPHLNAICLVPMMPHTLSNRPIVVDGNAKIELHILENESAPAVSCDGQPRLPISLGSKITIKKNTKTLQLIHPKNYTYFETLREKLGWHR